VRLALLNLETRPALTDTKGADKAFYLWCTLDCNYRRAHRTECVRLGEAAAGHTAGDLAGFAGLSLAGDVRVTLYLHRCRKGAEPQPSEAADELVSYLWFHTCFAQGALADGRPGLAFHRDDIDIKLRRNGEPWVDVAEAFGLTLVFE
jgi:hypothetical protein